MLEDISYYYRSPKCYSNKKDAEKEVSYFKKILNENPDSLKREIFLNKKLEWDYEILIKDILNGYSISLQKYETRFIVLDVDNNMENPISFKEFMDFLKELKIYPKLVFNTFSSTANHPKFRIFLDFKESINRKNYKKAATAIAKLINEKYPGCIDESKTNLGDIFYGCIDLIYYEKRNFNYLRHFIDLYNLINKTSEVVELNYTKFFSHFLNSINALSKEKMEKINEQNCSKIFVFNDFSNGHFPRVYNENTLIKGDYRYILSKYLLVRYNPLDVKHIKLGSWTNSKTIFYDELKTIVFTPLTFLLNQEENVLFKDILGKRDIDGNICLAKIYKNEDGKWYYWQIIKNHKGYTYKSYDIFYLLQTLFKLPSHYEIVEHIKTVCNLNNYKKEDCIKNIESFIKEFKKIKKYKNILKIFGETKIDRLTNLFNYCLEYEKKHFDNKYSLRTQMIRTFDKTENSGKTYYYETMSLAFKLGLLEKIPEENYNKAIKDFIDSVLNKRSFSKYDKKRFVKKFNVFYIPIWNKDLFKCIDEKLESIAKASINKNASYLLFNNLNYSYEKYLIDQIITKELLEKKYILRKTLIEKIIEENPGFTESKANRFLDKGLTDVLIKNNLVYKTITKKDIKKYKIKDGIVNNSVMIISA